MNHSLSAKTFYTLRYSNFNQGAFTGVRWRDSDGDEFPDWFVDNKRKWLPHAERMRQNVYKAQQKAQALLDNYPNITW